MLSFPLLYPTLAVIPAPAGIWSFSHHSRDPRIRGDDRKLCHSLFSLSFPLFIVIPAPAGIWSLVLCFRDPRFRGDDRNLCHSFFFVIPAQAGIWSFSYCCRDPRFRGDDNVTVITKNDSVTVMTTLAPIHGSPLHEKRSLNQP